MARTHSIPAITKVDNITNILKDGETVAINGILGEIYINPTPEEKQKIISYTKRTKCRKIRIRKI